MSSSCAPLSAAQTYMEQCKCSSGFPSYPIPDPAKLAIMFSVAIVLAVLATTIQGAPVVHPDGEPSFNKRNLIPGQTANVSYTSGSIFNFTDVPDPEPIRGSYGGMTTYQQLENEQLDQQNPDILASPGTDNGDVCKLLDPPAHSVSFEVIDVSADDRSW